LRDWKFPKPHVDKSLPNLFTRKPIDRILRFGLPSLTMEPFLAALRVSSTAGIDT